jgi:hypothetical protein
LETVPSELASTALVKRRMTSAQVRDAVEQAGLRVPEAMLDRVAAAYNGLLPGMAALREIELLDSAPAAVSQLEAG